MGTIAELSDGARPHARQRAHSDTCFPSRERRRGNSVCTKNMGATRMHFYKWPIDMITSEGHTQSRDVWQQCSHSTSATGLRGGDGGVNKMRQQHRYGPLQLTCPAFSGNKIAIALPRQLNPAALNHDGGVQMHGQCQVKCKRAHWVQIPVRCR